MATIPKLTDRAIVLKPEDDVAVAKAPLEKGAVFEDGATRIEARQDIKPGHKIARRAVGRGQPVRRYGQVIGFATQDIAVGEHVHTHNLDIGELSADRYEVGVDVRPVDFYPADRMRYFDGYEREDGRVGTRNYVAIISGVNCSASVSQFVKDKFRDVQRAVAEVAKLLPLANDVKRTKQPVSEICLATNCGGSDANSGMTANPALGWAVDELVRYGGTGVLAETPEIYGAEHLLIRRAINDGVAKKLIDRYKWWEWYCRGIEAMDNNPAPGNKAGGITTVFEKSLGGVTKGGTTPMMDVFMYGEPITTRGFVFMDTPGHDPVSITGLVAGGCNLICFTTGRGSVFGCKPVPSIKLATNSLMYRHMEEDMDINCGVILEGTPLPAVGGQIFEEIVAVASGKKSKSELSGVGEEEFAPWIIGPVM